MKKIFWLYVSILLCLISFSSEASAEGKKWGFVDLNGEVVIEPSFDYAYPYKNDMARIFVGNVGLFGPTEGKFGFINRKGIVIIEPKFDYCEDFNKYGQAVASMNGKYGIIDLSGNVLVDFKYSNMAFIEQYDFFLAYSDSESNSSVCYFIDINGIERQQVFDRVTIGDGCILDCSYELSPPKNALYSINGIQLSDYKFDYLYSLSDGLFGYKIGEKYGIIDDQGREVTGPEFEYIGPFYNKRAVAKHKGQYCLIDTNGTIIQSYNEYEIRLREDSDHDVLWAADTTKEGNKYYLMNSNGQHLSKSYDRPIHFIKDGMYYVNVKETKTTYIINTSGSEKAFPMYCNDIILIGDNRLLLYLGNQYVITDYDGNLLSNYEWDDVNYLNAPMNEWLCVCAEQ